MGACAVPAKIIGPGDDQHQPAPAGDLGHPGVKITPRLKVQAVMAKNHAATTWYPFQRRPQRVAHPFVGHQPLGGNPGVTGAHPPDYSTPMKDRDPAQRLADVQAAIAAAATLAGRRTDDVTLIAVSKTQPVEAIRPLVQAGQRVFGENRVQEAEQKWPVLRDETPDIAVHLIGQLQSNKAEAAVALFDAIHAVDRPSLVTALARAMDKTGRRPACFIQVNIGDEPQKGGVPTAGLAGLIAEARQAALPIGGLMCLPPADLEPAPYFALLAKLARDNGVTGLSMGMSSDFETAVTLGATHVRVGSALFGARA